MAAARRTAAAERDLEEIAFQIASEDGRPLTAERIVREIKERCDELATVAKSATMGVAAPRIGEGVRLFSYKRWVVLFRYDSEGVIVLRIADGSQDYLAWKLDD